MSHYIITLRRLLNDVCRLSQEEPLSFETQDIICKKSLEALRELSELERTTQSASVDNILEFRLRESTAEASALLACIVDASNN